MQKTFLNIYLNINEYLVESINKGGWWIELIAMIRDQVLCGLIYGAVEYLVVRQDLLLDSNLVKIRFNATEQNK